MATQGLTSEKYRQLIMNQPSALERQRLIEMQNQERRGINIPGNNQGGIQNLTTGQRSNFTENLLQSKQQNNQPSFLNVPYALGIDNAPGSGYFSQGNHGFANTNVNIQNRKNLLEEELLRQRGNPYTEVGPSNIPNLENQLSLLDSNPNINTQFMNDAISDKYNLDTGGLKKTAGMFDGMSGSDMMNVIMGLQGLLAQPDSNPRLDTSSPGASSGLRLPTQDLYAGLLK